MDIEVEGTLGIESHQQPYIIPYDRMTAGRVVTRLIYCKHRHNIEVLQNEELNDPRFYVGLDEEAIECLRLAGFVE